MQYFSDEFKRSLVVKMSVPGGRSASSLSKEVGISQSTLSRWLREGVTLRLSKKPMRAWAGGRIVIAAVQRILDGGKQSARDSHN
jgi:transposase-like protein